MGIPSSVVPRPQQPLEPQYVQAHEEKTRPKRRRKPQKPGKTAKNNDRHFVVHQYRDHSLDLESDVVHHEESSDDQEHPHRRRGGVGVAFPIKLHEVLDQVEADGLDHVISWQPHGRCFVIHKPKEFVDYVMPK
jgi:HSF-type DNA-binding